MIKKYKINITSQFYIELEELLLFSKYYPKSTKLLYEKIRNSILSLDIYPERFYRIPEIKDRNVRRLIVENLIIIYEVNNNFNQVFILHIYASKSNYLKDI